MFSDFNDQIFDFFNHIVGILTWSDFFNIHERLNLLNGQGVEEHAYELQ